MKMFSLIFLGNVYSVLNMVKILYLQGLYQQDKLPEEQQVVGLC